MKINIDDFNPIKEYLIRDKLKWLIINVKSINERDKINSILLNHLQDKAKVKLEIELYQCKSCSEKFPISEMKITRTNKMYHICKECFSFNHAEEGLSKTLTKFIDNNIGNKYDKEKCKAEYICKNCNFYSKNKYNRAECGKGWDIKLCKKASKVLLYDELNYTEEERLRILIYETLKNNKEIIIYKSILNRLKQKIINYHLNLKENETSKH